MSGVLLPPPPGGVADEPPGKRPRAGLPPGLSRRMALAEVGVVLAVFPLAAVMAAAQGLVFGMYGVASSPRMEVAPAGHPVVSLLLSLAVALPEFVPFLLVWHLLRRSRERLTDIGMDGRHPRSDLAWTAGLLLVLAVTSQVVAVVSGSLPGGINTPTGTNLPRYYVILGAVSGMSAGLVEEAVVLGYLWRRLEQLGWAPVAIFLTSLAVRISYHVYYGTGTLDILVFGLVMTGFYALRRRLLPCIVAHGVFDAVLFAIDIL